MFVDFRFWALGRVDLGVTVWVWGLETIYIGENKELRMTQNVLDSIPTLPYSYEAILARL